MRFVWLLFGLSFTALGFVGLALPGLPGTPFFLLAAWAFSRSSPRLLAWLLALPRIGPAIRDYHAGLGVPRRVKVIAVASATVAGTVSASLAQSRFSALLIATLVAAGVLYVLFRVPTRPPAPRKPD